MDKATRVIDNLVDSRIDSDCADFYRDYNYDNFLSFGACGTIKILPLCYFPLYIFFASSLAFYYPFLCLSHIT